MSKAFTKETDTEEDDGFDGVAPPIPAGSKNYITPQGFERLKTELLNLMDDERPKVVELCTGLRKTATDRKMAITFTGRSDCVKSIDAFGFFPSGSRLQK